MNRTSAHSRSQCRRLASLCALSLAGWIAGSPIASRADVVRDGSLGADVPIANEDGAFVIEEQQGERAGSNLFHSFAEFDLDETESAIFRGENSIENVISRITGGPSTIGGLIRSEIPGASLFLINPAGITFTPTARLDVDGSFHTSTADFLEFGFDPAQRFFADPGETSVLSPVDVSAFGFLGAPAPIELQGAELEVPEARALSLIGGPVRISDSLLSAPQGSIRIAGVASAGRIPSEVSGAEGSNLSDFSQLAEISIQNSALRAEGIAPFDQETSSEQGTPSSIEGRLLGGRVELQGGRLDLAGSLLSAFGESGGGSLDLKLRGTARIVDGSQLDASSRVDGLTGSLAGRIEVAAHDFLLDSSSLTVRGDRATESSGVDVRTEADLMLRDETPQSGILTQSFEGERGPGILLFSGRNLIIDRSDVLAASLGSGVSGSIQLTATKDLVLIGRTDIEPGSIRGVASGGFPDGARSGGIEFLGRSLLIDGQDVRTFGNSPLPSGDIRVAAENVDLINGGVIANHPFRFIGPESLRNRGGTIQIRAGSQLRVDGLRVEGVTEFGVFGRPSGVSAVNASDEIALDIQAPSLRVENGGLLSASAPVNSIDLRVGDLLLRGGSILSDGARPGTVRIRADRSLTISGESGDLSTVVLTEIPVEGPVLANAIEFEIATPVLRIEDGAVLSGRGLGTLLQLDVDDLFVRSGGSIQSLEGPLGRLEIRARRSVSITDPTSRISSFFLLSVSDDITSTGDIEIDTPFLTISNGGTLETTVTSEGTAGNISLAVDDLIVRSGGSIDSGSPSLQFGMVDPGNSSAAGAGEIDIRATGSVTIGDGHLPDNGLTSRIASSTSNAGRAGTISIQSPKVTIGRDGMLQALSIGDGDAGRILISADELTVDGGAILTSSEGIGRVDVPGGTNPFGNGDPFDALDPFGDHDLSSDRDAMADVRSDLGQTPLVPEAPPTPEERRALSPNGNGGDITIETRDRLILRDGAEVATSVAGFNGNGGNIQISSEVIVLDRSRISASAIGGDGGKIDIQSKFLLIDPNESEISASSELGQSGVVRIASPEADIARSLTALETTFVTAEELLPPRCTTLGAEGGRLVVAPRRGIPAAPEQLLIAYNHPEAMFAPADVAAGPREGSRSVASETWPAKATSGFAALTRGRFEQARMQLTAALASPAAPLSTGERASILLGAARANQELGDYAAAQRNLDRALEFARREQNPARVSAVLVNLGNVYAALGERARARTLLRAAVSLARTQGNSLAQATALSNLGNHELGDRRWEEALSNFVESGRLAQSVDTDSGALLALQSASQAARVALTLGDTELASTSIQAARSSLDRAGTSHDAIYARIHVAVSLARLARVGARERASELLAAHTLLTDAGRWAESADDSLAASHAWGTLGELYQSEGRFEEALALTRRALSLAEPIAAKHVAYRWHGQAGRILWAQGRAGEALAAFRRSIELLEEVRPESAAGYANSESSFQDAIRPIYLDMVDALVTSAGRVPPEQAQLLLREARATLELQKVSELRNYLRDDCIAELQRREIPVDSASSRAAIIYPVLLRDRVELLVSVGEQIKRYTPATPISRREVIEQATLLSALISRGYGDGYLRSSQLLYDWLVRPYVEELETAGVKTLVFVPDGPLRVLPLGALHDGKEFLVRQFALAVTIGLSITDPGPLDREDPRFLLAGLSENTGKGPALTHVVEELDTIQGLFGGQRLLDQEFTSQGVADKVEENVFSVIHLASHAEFTGDPRSSYVATYDGALTVDAFSELVQATRFRDDPLELLVLSGCETALGNDRAALGLAGFALRAGARSALGSLFRIGDEAALKLVTEFYRQLRDPSLSRAEALRRAQLSMIEREPFAHPSHWSGFVLIGNWL